MLQITLTLLIYLRNLMLHPNSGCSKLIFIINFTIMVSAYFIGTWYFKSKIIAATGYCNGLAAFCKGKLVWRAAPFYLENS